MSLRMREIWCLHLHIFARWEFDGSPVKSSEIRSGQLWRGSFFTIRITNFFYLSSLIMATCGEYIRNQFPTIDDDLYQYVEGMCVSVK